MSNSSFNSVKFDAPEFEKVFKRINHYENKQGYHILRQLNKFYSAQFEACIKSAGVDIANLQSLANSKFADQIQFLSVFVPNNLGDLNALRYVSPTFLYIIKKVNIIFSEGQYVWKQMTISQPLILRGANFIHKISKDQNNVSSLTIYCSQQDIQIIDSNFEGIGLALIYTNNIFAENSIFKNITNTSGLYFYHISNTITIDNVRFLDCQNGLLIHMCGNNASINKIFVQKCSAYGCQFTEINELNLNGVEIFDCEYGISLINSIGNIQNSIIDARNLGIYSARSTLNYHRTSIQQTDGSEGEFRKIAWKDSVIIEIL